MGGHKKRFITSCFAMQKRQLTGFRLIALKSLSDRPDPALPRRSVVEDDDLVRAGEVERRARPLIQHVAVEMLGPEQRDAVLERLTLIGKRGEMRLRRLHLLRQAKPGKKASVALDQMVAEIDHQADAKNGAGDEAGTAPDLLQNVHAIRESRPSYRVNSLLGRSAI